MATDKNKTGNAGIYGSHARTRSNGLEALESRLLFSAAALVPNVPEPVNDAATAIEASLVPDGPGDNGLGITEDGIGWIALPPTSSHATTEHINADDPEGSNPTPHPMPAPPHIEGKWRGRVAPAMIWGENWGERVYWVNGRDTVYTVQSRIPATNTAKSFESAPNGQPLTSYDGQLP